MSESSVCKILVCYGETMKKDFPEIKCSVHPHLLRHSRAMYLYQNGMDLTLISQWLDPAAPSCCVVDKPG